MMVDLRGPCGHLYAQLDIAEGVIVKKCPQCSKEAGGVAVYHCFDVETGKRLNGDMTQTVFDDLARTPVAEALRTSRHRSNRTQ
jgi:hypothetical protein